MKNLKLTNISLAVLVALGLVACGGSNDSTDHTTDKDKIELEKQKIEAEKKKLEEAKKKQEEEQKRLQEEKEKLEKEKKEDKGKQETPKPDDKNKPLPEKTGTEVQRYNPTLSVPDDMKGIVADAKKFAIRRGFADPALGYVDSPDSYSKKAGTSPANIKYTSMYNFIKQRDVIASNGGSVTADYKDAAKGAINVGLKSELASKKLNAWAKGKNGKYYRVEPNKTGDAYTEETTFKVLKDDNVFPDPQNIKQEDIYFIANAKDDVNLEVLVLGKAADYNLKQAQVAVNNFTVTHLDGSFSPDGLSQKLDLSKYPVNDKEIQEESVMAEYQIRNTKNSSYENDNKVITDKTTVGKVRIYNLPYSVAFVTTDVTGKDLKPENNKDIFKINNGTFQLNGVDTPALPKNGRAKYTGKSFSATVDGNIELFADFSLESAGIYGRIYDRVDHANNDEPLQELTLKKIKLSTPSNSWTEKAGGKVVGDASYATEWSVRLFGMDAQEAGGFLKNSSDKVVEVYSTRRGRLTDKSNEVSNTD